MKMLGSRGAASMAALAAFSMTATPVLAHGYGGWGRHYHRHGDGIDGGDVLAGLLVVGGIAAIASAASKSARDEQVGDENDRYPGGPDYSEPQDRDYSEAPDRDDDTAGPGYGAEDQGAATQNGSFDDAVNRCADELERSERRIGSVDSVARAGDRYSVEGRLEDGRGFACSVDRDGDVRSIDVDGHALI